MKQNFYISKFPVVFGALDCTYVNIKSSGGDNAKSEKAFSQLMCRLYVMLI